MASSPFDRLLAEDPELAHDRIESPDVERLCSRLERASGTDSAVDDVPSGRRLHVEVDLPRVPKNFVADFAPAKKDAG